MLVHWTLLFQWRKVEFNLEKAFVARGLVKQNKQAKTIVLVDYLNTVKIKTYLEICYYSFPLLWLVLFFLHYWEEKKYCFNQSYSQLLCFKCKVVQKLPTKTKFLLPRQEQRQNKTTLEKNCTSCELIVFRNFY